jgi:excisionase family DNA binding protein
MTGAGTRERFLSPLDVAKLAGVNPRTVIRWADNGMLPLAFRTPGQHRRFRRADVDAFLAAQREPDPHPS